MASEKIDALELDINAKLTTENLDKLITALGRLSKALDNVNANSVIGKIYLVIDGVINDITIDLIALPSQTDLNEYRA